MVVFWFCIHRHVRWKTHVHDDFRTVFGLRDQLLTWLDSTWIVNGVPCSFRYSNELHPSTQLCWNHSHHGEFCNVFGLRDQLLTWHELWTSNHQQTRKLCLYRLEVIQFFYTPRFGHMSRFANFPVFFRKWVKSNWIVGSCNVWKLFNFFTPPILDGGFWFCIHRHVWWNHSFHDDFCNVFGLRDQLLTWHEWYTLFIRYGWRLMMLLLMCWRCEWFDMWAEQHGRWWMHFIRNGWCVMMSQLMRVEHVNNMDDMTHKPSVMDIYALGSIIGMMSDKNKLTLSRRGCGLCWAS